MSGNLNQVEAPALPLGPEQYNRPYQDQLNNVHRLFYNRLTNIVNAVLGSNGGKYIDCPNGLFFNTADQTFPAANTAYPVVFNATYLHNAVQLQTGSTSKIEVTVGGIYNFQYAGQLKSGSSNSKSVWLWIRRNGVDIGYSTQAYTLANNNEYKSIIWNFDIDLEAGEYLELVVAADSTDVWLDAEAASSPHPGIPSGVMTVNFIAPLPDPRPTPP